MSRAPCGVVKQYGRAVSPEQVPLVEPQAPPAGGAGSRLSGRQTGSGVLSFANIIGRNVALLPTNFGQPPFCVPCNIFKVQDLESLID